MCENDAHPAPRMGTACDAVAADAQPRSDVIDAPHAGTPPRGEDAPRAYPDGEHTDASDQNPIVAMA